MKCLTALFLCLTWAVQAADTRPNIMYLMEPKGDDADENLKKENRRKKNAN